MSSPESARLDACGGGSALEGGQLQALELLTQGHEMGWGLASGAIAVRLGLRLRATAAIGAPLLLDGLKFDLRLYVLVTSISPVRAYLYREGLARFAVDSYVAPSRENLRNVHMHLTNYSLNKFSDKFVKNTSEADDGSGSKWSLSAFQRRLVDARADRPPPQLTTSQPLQLCAQRRPLRRSYCSGWRREWWRHERRWHERRRRRR